MKSQVKKSVGNRQGRSKVVPQIKLANALLDQLKQGPVVTRAQRKLLIEQLERFPGDLLLHQESPASSRGRPKKDQLKDIIPNLWKDSAAEFFLALSREDPLRQKKDSAYEAIEWFKAKCKAHGVSKAVHKISLGRSSLYKLVGELEASGAPIRSSRYFHGKETEEESNRFELEYDQYREQVDAMFSDPPSRQDMESSARVEARHKICWYATQVAKKVVQQASDALNYEFARSIQENTSLIATDGAFVLELRQELLNEFLLHMSSALNSKIELASRVQTIK
jgi:hypothetical protein